MNRVLFYCLFLISILILGCNLDKEVNLGSNYFLFGYEDNSCISKRDSSNKSLSHDILLGEIVKYNFDERYILIHRRETKSAKRFFIESPLWEEQSGDQDQIWIIDKAYDKLFGPYNLESYMRFRELNKLPYDFKLEL